MGVKNLKKFIREKYPNEIQKLNLSDFYGQMIMMDIMSYIYKFKVTMREKWLQSIIVLIKLFKSNNVHVNIVFEGESPKEKNKEKEQRRQQRKQQEQKILNIKNDINEYNQNGNISELLKETYKKINQTDTTKINRLLHFNNDKNVNYEITTLDYKMLQQIEEYIDKKENQLVVITEQDINKIKEICDTFGVPYFQSENEAETLCCEMCMNVKDDQNNNLKQPIGVISEDSDVLAYGANMLICDLNISNGDCNVIYLPSLLKTMNFTYNEFLDFCILSGTDYNINIPGIGSVKCLEFINKYRSIENIFTNENKLIEKKINEAIKKKKSENLENIDTTEDIDKNMTIEKLHNDMKRSNEMFGLIKKSNNKSEYWDCNLNFDKICECCLRYNIDYNSIEKIWTNNIKFQ